MTITLSDHAVKRCNERQISLQDINQTIKQGIKNPCNNKNKIKYIYNDFVVIAKIINHFRFIIITVHYA
jgi:hypothetical protein